MKPRPGMLVLLFGLTAGQEKLVRTAGLRLGLRCRAVPAAHYNRTLSQLLSGRAEDVPDYDGPVPDAAVLLMAGLSGKILESFLNQLRKAGLSTSVMKAVLTEQNSRWTALTLIGELNQEREALASGAGPAHAPE